jgi:hypothetical protein
MEIRYEKDNLVVKLSFWETIWGMHSNFSIPKKNVVSLKETEPVSGWWDIKFPGTFFPGLIKAGSYLTRRGREYWFVNRNHKFFYTIELKDMAYKRLVLGVTIKQVNAET